MALDEKASRYVAVVHRKRVGDRLSLFSAGLEADADIVGIDAGVVTASVGAPRALPPRRRVTLLQALGKADKIEAVIRDATELGATRIVPTETARTIVKLGDKAATKLERWSAIAVDAARQCGRALPPDVRSPVDLATALDEPGDLRVLLSPSGDEALAPLLWAARGTSLVIAVGPEGGFAPDEVELAASKGFRVARLGDVVLRTETVAAAVLGAALVLEGMADA